MASKSLHALQQAASRLSTHERDLEQTGDDQQHAENDDNKRHHNYRPFPYLQAK